jgi:hypothetical protein
MNLAYTASSTLGQITSSNQRNYAVGEYLRSTTVTIEFRAVILGENTPHHVSINLKAKRLRDDSRDTGIAKTLIPAFEFDNGTNQFLRWTFRSGFASAVSGKQRPIFSMN